MDEFDTIRNVYDFDNSGRLKLTRKVVVGKRQRQKKETANPFEFLTNGELLAEIEHLADQVRNLMSGGGGAPHAGGGG